MAGMQLVSGIVDHQLKISAGLYPSQRSFCRISRRLFFGYIFRRHRSTIIGNPERAPGEYTSVFWYPKKYPQDRILWQETGWGVASCEGSPQWILGEANYAVAFDCTLFFTPILIYDAAKATKKPTDLRATTTSILFKNCYGIAASFWVLATQGTIRHRKSSFYAPRSLWKCPMAMTMAMRYGQLLDTAASNW